jgi:hypothetical protein
LSSFFKKGLDMISNVVSPPQRRVVAADLASEALTTLLVNQGIGPASDGSKLRAVTVLDLPSFLSLRVADRHLRDAADAALNRGHAILPSRNLQELDVAVESLKRSGAEHYLDDSPRLTRRISEVVSRAFQQSARAAGEATPQIVSQWDHATQRNYAKWSGARPEILALLAKTGNAKVQMAVGRHPNTSARTFASLARRSNVYVVRAVASNPGAPESLLRRLATHHLYPIRAGVAINPSAPKDILAAFTKDESDVVRAHAAINTQTPAEDLDEMVKKGDFEWLIGSEDAIDFEGGEVYHCSVCSNDNAWDSTLNSIAQSPALLLPGSVCSADRTPLSGLQAILSRVEAMEAGATFELISTPDILLALAKHPNADNEFLMAVKALAVSCLDAAEVDTINVAIANHQNTAPDALRSLKNGGSDAVLLALKLNPNTPEATRVSLPDAAALASRVLGSIGVEEELGINPTQLYELLESYPELYTSLALPQCIELRDNIVQDESAPVAVLRRLAQENDDDWYLKALIAAHPNTTGEIIESLRVMLDNRLAAVEFRREDLNNDELILARALAPNKKIPITSLCSWMGISGSLDRKISLNTDLQKVAARFYDRASASNSPVEHTGDQPVQKKRRLF